MWGNSFAAEDLPAGGTGVVVDAVTFTMPPTGTGAPDNVRCAGQYLDLGPQADLADWLYLLAAGERRVEDEIALHFADGSVDFEPVRVSDFWAAPPAFGETKAFATLMHYPIHTQFGVPATIWCQRVPVTRRAPLTGIGLPHNVALHIFAATLQPAAARPAALEVTR
ncbi:hypothetical protein GCM10010172_64980 [Paractinoplanes ferrugineus]|uniref:Uncharacterized protein n=1 Tax=Paractinoplanes ferrugineus TaxID=113564 RepID=A0A919J4S0_9ACTN|nr:hypothetical protein Afe05nite_51820 [Actinoplanes ferrugineus]